MHGGSSTGPKTPEGRKRVGDATRRRYVEAALADGWVIASPKLRTYVEAVKVALIRDASFFERIECDAAALRDFEFRAALGFVEC